MKKTSYAFIGTLDMRDLTEEKAARIQDIAFAGAILVGEDSARYLSGISMGHCGATVTVPRQDRLVFVGEGETIRPAMAAPDTFFVVTGKASVDPAFDPSALMALRGVVCAKLTCPESLAPSVCMQTNGNLRVYPDGWTPVSDIELDETFVISAREGQRFHAFGRVRLTKETDISGLIAKNVRIKAVGGALVKEECLPLFARICDDAVTVIPAGYTYVSNLNLDRIALLTNKGRIYVGRNLSIAEDMPADKFLAVVEDIIVKDKLTVGEELLEVVLERVSSYGQLKIRPVRVGTPVDVNGNKLIEAGYLDGIDKPISLTVNGDVAFMPDVTPEAIRAKIENVTVNGDLYCSGAQEAALSGRITQNGERKPYESFKDWDEEEEDVITIAHMGYCRV